MTIHAYIRVSSKKNAKGESRQQSGMDSQRQAIATYCRSQRIKPQWHEDYASGTSSKRSALQSMLATVKAGDRIILTDLSRLSRQSVSKTLDLVESLMNNGVAIQCLNQGLVFDKQNAMSEFTLSMLAAISRLESTIKSERIKNGLRASQKARKNRPLSANREQVAKMLRTKSPAEVAAHYGVTTRAIYLMKTRNAAK